MTVYQTRKSPYWQYDFQINKKRYHGSTGVETKRAAEKFERNLRTKAALGELDDDQDMDVDLGFGRWWEEVGKHRASAYQLEHRAGIASRLIGPKTKLRDITTKSISIAIEIRRGEGYTRAKDRPARDGKPAKRAKVHTLSNATVNADVAKPLQRMLNRARKVWGIKNLPEIDWSSLALPEPEQEIRLYSGAQQAAWSAQCDATSRYALRLLLTYGLRFSETFFPPEAFIPDAPGGPVLAINKRKRGVLYMPLREDDAREIAARVGQAVAAGLKSTMIERAAGRKLVEVNKYALASRIRVAAKRADLVMPRLIHGTRHHVGTSLLAETGDLKLTQQALGHADIKSTLRYAHAMTGKLRDAMNSRNSPGVADAGDAFTVPDQPRRRKRL
ncbi:MAG TPA: tyrosine-type recombinase/integrase [Brevundimonas sp.]|nr:tyrosine-type recombinase/integrase [Brevundimonas sp.]